MISSVQLLVLGLIGEYVGRIYIQSKNRPLFVISHIHRRGRLPHNMADGEGDIERDSFKTLLAQSGPKARSRAYDEAS
jgi:dolichol-phosphate mannosyltransferase